MTKASTSLGVDLDIDRVHIGEALEEDRLAFHHRLGGERAQIAQAQDRGAVGDDRHEIALGGIVVDRVGPFRDGPHGNRHARRIGETQIPLGRHRLGGRDLDFAGLAAWRERRVLLRAVNEWGVGHALSVFEPIHRISRPRPSPFNGGPCQRRTDLLACTA